MRIIAAGIFFVISSLALQSATLVVDQSGVNDAFTSVNAALDTAKDGDIIDVMPGLYVESLFVDKQVTIIGFGVGNTVLSAVFENAITLTANKPLSVQNILIRAGGSGIAAPANDEMRLRDSEDSDRRFVSIKNCVITYCGRAGVFFETPGSILITNSILKNNGQSSVLIDAMDSERRWNGGWIFPLRLPTDLSISNSLLVNNGKSGVNIERSNNGGVSITNSIITNNAEFAVDNRIVRRSRFETNDWLDDDTAEFEILRINFSCLWNNQQGTHPIGNTGNNVLGSGISMEESLFDDNFNLSNQSLCRDAGDSSPSANDPDGSRNDAGAFGGPGAAGWKSLDASLNPPKITDRIDFLVVDKSGSNGTYTSIGAAIQAAEDGDVIKVMPGTYEERLTLDKQVNIIGSGVENTTVSSLFGDAFILSSDKP